MDIYLPIANLSVNALVIIGLGGLVGLLSGMFGVGGGFLTTPLLIFYGIPPTVAAASAASQVTGASVSGVFAHLRRKGVDFQMGAVMVAGGVLGSLIGAWHLQAAPGDRPDRYGDRCAVRRDARRRSAALMAREALQCGRRDAQRPASAARSKRRHHPLVAALPLRMALLSLGALHLAARAADARGADVGILTMLLGVGGGFILVPAMIYLLGMATQVVVGTIAVPDPVRHRWRRRWCTRRRPRRSISCWPRCC